VNVRQLQYFLQIAELRSFTRAANVLHIAQPALSRQIRALEDELGTALFHRFERGVTLTEAGLLLRDRAAGILRDLERLREDITAQGSDPRGEVSLGMPPSMREMVTVPLAGAVRQRHPQVVMHLYEGISVFLNEQVRLGKIDCAVVSDLEPLAQVESEPLLSEQLYLLAPAEAGLQADQPVSLETVSQQTLILTSRPNSLRLIVENALAAAQLPLRIVIDGNSTAAMVDLVAEGVGCSVLPYCAADSGLRQGRLSAAPIEGLRVAWTLIYSRERGLSPVGSLVRSLLQEMVRGRIDARQWPNARLAGAPRQSP
jgi:LysR family nitrogen assimilation transcriptional regulator